MKGNAQTLPTELDNLFNSISELIKVAKYEGFIKNDYFNTTIFNKEHESHSKLLGIICMVASKLGYFLEIERGLTIKRQFRPDIIIRKNSEWFAVIEYESTNSSDKRVLDSDFDSFINYIKLNPSPEHLPKYWIIIVTLPDHKVDEKKWKSWAVERKYKDRKKKILDEKYRQIVSNPFKFYMPQYTEKLNKIYENIFKKTELILCNLQEDKLDIVFPKKYKKEYAVV